MALTRATLTQPIIPTGERPRSDVSLAYEKGSRLLHGSMDMTFHGFGGDFLKNIGLEDAGNRWLADAYQSGILMGMDANEIDEQMQSPRSVEDIEDWKGGLAWGINAVAEHIPVLMMQFIPAVTAGLLTKFTPVGRVVGAVGLGARGASTAAALATIDWMNTSEVYSELLMATGESRPQVAATTGGLMSILDALIPLKILNRMKLGPDFTRWFGKQLKNPAKGIPAMLARNVGYGAGEGVTEGIQTMFEGMALNYVQEKGILAEFSEAQRSEQLEGAARGALIGTLLSIPVAYRGPSRAAQETAKKYSSLQTAMQGLRDEHGSSAPVSEDLRGYDSPVTDAIRAKAEGAGVSEPDVLFGIDRAAGPGIGQMWVDKVIPGREGKRFGGIPQVGDTVQWTSMGVDMLAPPRRITGIEYDEAGNGWAQAEGSQTFMPLNELTKTVWDTSREVSGLGARQTYTDDPLLFDETMRQRGWDKRGWRPLPTDTFKKDIYDSYLTGKRPISPTDSAVLSDAARLVELRGKQVGLPGTELIPTGGLPVPEGIQSDLPYMPDKRVTPFNLQQILSGRIEGVEDIEVEEGRRGIQRVGFDPWSLTRLPGPENMTAKMGFFGYMKTGEMERLNRDGTPAKIQSKEGNSIYESVDFTIQKDSPYRGAKWAAISKETGQIITRGGTPLDLAKSHSSAPIDVTAGTSLARLEAAKKSEKDIRGISFEQVLAQQGRLVASKGDKVRLYVKDTETGRWYHPDDRQWLVLGIEQGKPKGLTGKQFTVATPVTTVYELEPIVPTGPATTATLGPTEDNVRLVPILRKDWNFPEYFGPPISPAEALIQEPLTTEEDIAELRPYTELGEAERAQADVIENRKEFNRLVNEDENFAFRLAEALVTAESVRGKDKNKVSDNLDRLQRRPRADIEKFINEKFLTEEEVTAKYNEELLDASAMLAGEAGARLETKISDAAAQIEKVARTEGILEEELMAETTKPVVPEGEAEADLTPAELTELRRLEPSAIELEEQKKADALEEQKRKARLVREEYTQPFKNAMVTRRKEIAEATRRKSVTLTTAELEGLKQEFIDEGRAVYVKIKGTKPAPLTDAELEKKISTARGQITTAVRKGERAEAAREFVGPRPAPPKERPWLKGKGVPKGSNLIDTIVPETRLLPAPETHRVKVSPEMAEKHGLSPTLFYPYEVTGWSDTGGLIRVMGRHIHKDDIVEVEESTTPITVTTEDFVEFYSENYYRNRPSEKGPELAVDIPDAIPNKDRVRRVWIDNKDGIIITQSLPSTSAPVLFHHSYAPTMKLAELGEYSELGYDYDVYRVWESRWEHKQKLRAEFDRVIAIDKASRKEIEAERKKLKGRPYVVAEVDLREDKTFLTTDYEQNTRRGAIRVTISPIALTRINKARGVMGLAPITEDSAFKVQRAYGKAKTMPPGGAFAKRKGREKPPAPPQFAWLDFLKSGEVKLGRTGKRGKLKEVDVQIGAVDPKRVRDRELLIEQGAQLWSTEGVPVPLKNRVVITDSDGHQWTIPVTTAKTATITRYDIPDRVGVMTPYESLAEQAPERGVQLVASFRGDVKEDAESLKEFMADMFSPETHRFGILDSDREKIRQARSKELVEYKGLNALVDFHDGSVKEGKIGKVYWGGKPDKFGEKTGPNVFELVIEGQELPLLIDVLAFDRLQVDKPVPKRKPGVVPEGPADKPIDQIYTNPETLITYYPVFGKAAEKLITPKAIDSAPIRVEVTRDGDDYFILSDEDVSGERFSRDQVIAYLNNLSDEVGMVEGLNIVRLPVGITYDTTTKDIKRLVSEKVEGPFPEQYTWRTEEEKGMRLFKSITPEKIGRYKGFKDRRYIFRAGYKHKFGALVPYSPPVDTARIENKNATVTQVKFNQGVTIRKPRARKSIRGKFDPDFVGIHVTKGQGKRTKQPGLVTTQGKHIVRFIPDKGKPEELDFDTLDIRFYDQSIEELEQQINEYATQIAKDANSGLSNAGVAQIGMWDTLYKKNKEDYEATKTEYLAARKAEADKTKNQRKIETVASENAVADDTIKPYKDVKVKPLGLFPENQKFMDSQGTEWKVISQIGNIDRTMLKYVGGKKPSEAIFKVAYEGKKGVTGWKEGMDILVESNMTAATLFTAKHKPAGQPPVTKLTEKQWTERWDVPYYSIVRNFPLNGERGSINLNTGLTPETFRRIISKRIGRLNLKVIEKEGSVKIVQNQTDVPNAPTGMGIKAVVRNGKLWFVTNNIMEEEVGGVFTHEVGVHLGMKEVFGADYELILESARNLRDSSPEWRDAFAAAEEVSRRLLEAPHAVSDTHRQKWEQMTDVALQDFVAEEAIGYYTEAADPYTDSFWSMLLDLFRRGKARAKRYFGKTMNEDEIIAFVRGSVRGMVGRNLDAAHNRITEYYSAVLSGTPEYWDDAVVEEVLAKTKDHDSMAVLEKVASGRDYRMKVRKFFNPFAYLPQEALLRKFRGAMQGKLQEVEEAGQELLKIYDNLSEQDNQDLYDFFTNKYAKPSEIANEKLRDISVQMKEAILNIGQKAYEKELFKGEAEVGFKNLQGAYLPQVFLSHIVANRNTSTPFGRKMSQQHWTKARIDLDEVSKQTKVPITDVKYLLYKAFTVPQEDMIIMDYLSTLSEQQAFTSRQVPTGEKRTGDITDLYVKEQEVYKSGKKKGQPKMKAEADIGFIPWVMPQQWISYESTNSDGKKIKRRTTLAALQNEFSALKQLRDHVTPTEEQRRLIEDRLVELETVKENYYQELGLPKDADAMGESTPRLDAYFDTAYNTKNFRRLPSSDRYGALSGLWVRKEIYEDIVGNADLHTGEQGLISKMFNPYGTHAKLVGIYKTLKVPMNPPTVVRNFVSNMMLMQLSGLPFHKQPKYLMAALRELRGDSSGITFKDSITGKTFTAYELALRQGIGATTLTSAEIRVMETVFRDMERHGIWSILTRGGKKWQSMSKMASKLYQNIEVLGKTAFIMHSLENKVGELEAITREEKNLGPEIDGVREPLITIEDAAVQEANLALFDYSEVSPTVKGLRSSFWGAPFITFQTKVAPLLLRTALKHPTRFLPYVMLGAGIQAAFGGLPFVDDDWDKIKKLLPEWARQKGNLMLLPWKNMEGNIMAIDLSYFFPWAAFAEVPKALRRGEFQQAAFDGGIVGPAFQLAAALLTGKDAWSGRSIIDEHSPTSDKVFDLLAYGAQMSMPPFLTRRGIFSIDAVMEAAVRLDHRELDGKLMDAMYGRTNRWGETKRDYIQVLMSLVGMNTYSINPRARSVEIRRFGIDQRRMEREISSVRKDRSLTTNQKRRTVNALRDRIDKKREERAEYIRETAGIERTW